ncbi:unnamed protein product [Owenia fusiformis]|uniref:CUB domain-containing protein n=1 Tax=Owenia fusiformis TaxID=6347 RepID=A0A8S4N1A4_OWEFU|nr:unnamed protein product [Owenia fusiformis]
MKQILQQLFVLGLLMLVLGITQTNAIASIYLTRCSGVENYPAFEEANVFSQKDMNYSGSIDCQATVSVPEGYRMEITFNLFDIQPKVDGECVDFLQIYEGTTAEGSAVTEKLCGNEIPRDLTLDTNKATIVFHTDEAAENGYKGYELTYRQHGMYQEDKPTCYSCTDTTNTGDCFNNTQAIGTEQCPADKPYCYSLAKYNAYTDEFISVERGCTSGTMAECLDNTYCSSYRCNSYKCNHSEKKFYRNSNSVGSNTSSIVLLLFTVLMYFA